MIADRCGRPRCWRSLRTDRRWNGTDLHTTVMAKRPSAASYGQRNAILLAKRAPKRLDKVSLSKKDSGERSGLLPSRFPRAL